MSYAWVSAGCAGPATPLGAVWSISPVIPAEAKPSGTESMPATISTGGTTLRFDPLHQQLHGRAPFKVVIEDPSGVPDEYEFWVRYQGVDVTETFLRQSTVRSEGKRLEIEMRGLKLGADADHRIEVGYRSPTGGAARARYPAPVCRAFGTRAIRSTGAFEPSEALLKEIERASQQAGFSPSFTAALVAQESAFEPKTVSWARAVGLTQVTPSAESEILGLISNSTDNKWPRYPGLDRYPAAVIQALVVSGRVNARNEWRLEPSRSLRGGLAFARHLSERWQDSFLRGGAIGALPLQGDGELVRTQLMLASYHSGFARVQGAVHRLGPRWLSSPDLKGARVYVNRIMSYCDLFQRDL